MAADEIEFSRRFAEDHAACHVFAAQQGWLAPWKDSVEKPAIYHCISWVAGRWFVFGDKEREKFRVFMRMQENFSGCRVLSYRVMFNHFHILLKVPPMAAVASGSTGARWAWRWGGRAGGLRRDQVRWCQGTPSVCWSRGRMQLCFRIWE